MTSLAQSPDAYGASTDQRSRYAAVHLRDMPAALAAQRHPGGFIAEYCDEPLAVQTQRRPTRLEERHRKGFWSWVSTILFYGWQALCVLWVAVLFKADAAGPFLLTVAFFTWFGGTLLLAVFRHVTRGRSVVTVVQG